MDEKYEKELRDLVLNDLKSKLLGPGYAQDIISCDNLLEEIIPERPRNAYRVGFIKSNRQEAEGPENDMTSGEEEIPDETIVNDTAIDEPIADNEERARQLSERNSDRDDSDDDSPNDDMMSHIGLVVCLASKDNEIEIDFSYGTYTPLEWKDEIGEVKIKTGPFTSKIKEDLKHFDNSDIIKECIKKIEGLKDTQFSTLGSLVAIDEQAGTISLNDELTKLESRPALERISLQLPNDKSFEAEGKFIQSLFRRHYKRQHHGETKKTVVGSIDSKKPIIFEDDYIRILASYFERKGKVYLKILLQSKGVKDIFQPEIRLRGDFISYTEPITSLREDKENNLNEFIYRNVKNYGKGINCAINWDEDAKCVYTSFTPTVDVEKFTNNLTEASSELKDACTLRNLSIWNRDDEKLLDLLERFVAGYVEWHKSQEKEAESLKESFPDETKTILDNQKELVERLNENVAYLIEKPEALQCFKIANTAMLLQMVVARHPRFKKNRNCEDYDNETTFYNNLKYFKDATYIEDMKDGDKTFPEPSYYPFQLAFLLMNVKSTFELGDPYRKSVDLIWFPTGGGKTEAYLALTALTIVHRRRRGQERGVSVIMRYTLRLLTTQQFERASYLICALDFLRRQDNELKLGKNSITIGLYVGSKVTPNDKDDLTNIYPFDKFFREDTDKFSFNPFPVTYCPWCGARLVKNKTQNGYRADGSLQCMNTWCSFNEWGLPIKYIDNLIYDKAPTLLFATVDKFAQLYRTKSKKLLRPDKNDTPDLFIQDELHLIVGALGSIVGFYEPIIEELCTKDGRYPKIIASTATTRNTNSLIKSLYNRETRIFPPQGLEYKNNYFSRVEEGESKRRHMGLIPAACVSSNVLEIRVTALLLLARVKLFKKYIEDQGKDWMKPEDVKAVCVNADTLTLVKELDNYWTSVLYFNSLKDLGRSSSRIRQEVFENFRAHTYLYAIPDSLAFLRETGRFDQRVVEFTSRIDSSKIKFLLEKAEHRVGFKDTEGKLYVDGTISTDLVLASNMISVGIDVKRWNLMLMVGQPRSTSEYVQSSSRAARDTYGLVLNLLNPRRVRELSLFENFVPYHRTYYKAVEPLSITPLTFATIKHRVLQNVVEIYNKLLYTGSSDLEDKIDAIFELYKKRFDTINEKLEKEFRARIEDLLEEGTENYAQSLREIDADAFIKIKNVNYKKD